MTDFTAGQQLVLTFPANLCVLAGAGSGKTMTLVELVLRLLAGEIPGRPDRLDLTQILALTYTEKAAREMRGRLRAGLNQRLDSSALEQRSFWLRQRRLLDRASIATIHGFALRILKAAALAAGLDPDFTLLEDDRDFLDQARREALLDLIESEDPELLVLLDYYPWLSSGHKAGLDRLLALIETDERTYGRPLSAAEPESADPAPAVADLSVAADRIEALLAAGKVKLDKEYGRTAAALAAAIRKKAARRPDPEAWIAEIPTLGNLIRGNWYAAKNAKDLAQEALRVLSGIRDQRQAAPLRAGLLNLSHRLAQAVARAKSTRRLLDFDDLLIETRRLLARNPELRTRIKKRFQVILVDEFQDTNRLQADLIALLTEPEEAESAESVLDPGNRLWETLPPAPGRLVVFGDPKQSIYRFRGAEVQVFQQLRASLTGPAASGALVPLKDNFRSQARLVNFFNEFFRLNMPAAPQAETGPSPGYLTSHGPADEQESRRPDLAAEPGAWLLAIPTLATMTETQRAEAIALAAWLTELLDSASGWTVADGRKPQPGDVAILLRRFTHLKAYEEALTQAGLPFHTVRGRGFYRCPEVWDLINLLGLLAEPHHDPAWLGALRSPLIGLTDRTITRLAWPEPGQRMQLAAWFGPTAPPWPDGLEAREIARLDAARTLLVRLRAAAGRAFPAELVEMAVEATDYLAVLLALPQGQRKAANVQRFIEVARRRPSQALSAPLELVRFLKARLADSSDDPEAQSAAEGAQAIQVMTIHQAKGLEFPVVLVPDAGQRPLATTGSLIITPDDRLAVSFRDPETLESRRPPDYLAGLDEEKARDQAEHLRLLYVAATRARDILLFSGSARERNEGDRTWLARLHDFAASRPELLGRIDYDLLMTRERIPAPPARPDQDMIRLTLPSAEPGPGPGRLVIRNALDRPRPRPGLLTVNVTDLTKYWNCPGRYYLENLRGLAGAEAPDGLETPSDPLPEPGGDHATGLTPRERGLAFHHLMETLDPAAPLRLDQLIRRTNRWAGSRGLTVDLEEATRIALRVLDFLDAPWGQHLRRSADGLLLRETPLWLRIEPESPDEPRMILTGEIDLFFVTPEGQGWLIDYKYARPKEATRYAPQVRTYALALVRAGLAADLAAGLYFAQDRPGVMVDVPLELGWMERLTAELQAAAKGLADLADPDYQWPGPPAECPDSSCDLGWACRSGEAAFPDWPR